MPPGYTTNSNPQLQQALPQLAAAAAAAAAAVNSGQLPTPAAYLPFPQVSPTGFPIYPGAIPTPPNLLKSSANSSKITNQIQSTAIHHNSSTGNSLGAAALQRATPQPASHSPNTNHPPQHQSRYNHNNSHSSNGHLVSSKNIAGAIPGYLDKDGNSYHPDIKIPVDQLIPSHFLETRIRTRSDASSPGSSIAGSPHPECRNSDSPAPSSLQDHEVQKLAETAIHLIRSLPPSVAQPKFSSKKKTSGDYEVYRKKYSLQKINLSTDNIALSTLFIHL